MMKWEMGDPLKVAIGRESRRQKPTPTPLEQLQALFEDRMTEEQSDKMEDLIMTWYEYERGYRPNLGAPRVSASSRGFTPSEIYDDASEAEIQYRKGVAEAVEACVDELALIHRQAVQIHCCAKLTGASVIRNPRMTIEQHHQQYQAAKQSMWEMPRMRALVR